MAINQGVWFSLALLYLLVTKPASSCSQSDPDRNLSSLRKPDTCSVGVGVWFFKKLCSAVFLLYFIGYDKTWIFLILYQIHGIP